MNTDATIVPLVAAISNATVMAMGTARWIWFAATVIAGKHEERRANHQVAADAFSDAFRIGMHVCSRRSA